MDGCLVYYVTRPLLSCCRVGRRSYIIFESQLKQEFDPYREIAAELNWWLLKI